MAAAAPVVPRRTVFIVLPAFNEAHTLPGQLTALREHLTGRTDGYHVIVVDDGSRDTTAAVAESFAATMPLTLVRHAVNQGLGAALRDGLRAALEHAEASDVVVTADADDTQGAAHIDDLLRAIDAGRDVAIASRYRRGARMVGVPLRRRALSRGASWLLRLACPIPGVRDFTCGYRAYRATALRQAIAHHGGALITQDGFPCMVDILLQLRPLGLSYGEVPLVLRYDRKHGRSKMAVGRTAWDTLRLVARHATGQLTTGRRSGR